MYLVDTNVISALATKSGRHDDVADWLDGQGQGLFLSVVTAAEVVCGIAKAEREGATAKAARLREWWHAVEELYASRILPVDVRVSRAIGRMMDAARAHAPGFGDIAIAATAQAHGLTVLTRNLRHFSVLGVAALDPFQVLPSASP